MPAAFFLPTGLLANPQLPWWDHVACVLKQTQVPGFTLPRQPGDPGSIRVELGPDAGADQRTAGIATVIGEFLNGAIPDVPWFLAQLEARAEVQVDGAAQGQALFMSLDQVKQLQAAGMSIGSHGESHRALADLDDAAQMRELTASRQFLEQLLGVKIRALAYPFGWEGTFTARTIELAAEAGYHLAFSAREGINRPGTTSFQPYSLHRLNVGAGDSPALLRARAISHVTLGRSFL